MKVGKVLGKVEKVHIGKNDKVKVFHFCHSANTVGIICRNEIVQVIEVI